MDIDRTGARRGIRTNYEAVIVDDLEFFINDIIEAALKAKVDIATMSLDCKDSIELPVESTVNTSTANLIV